MIQRHYRLMPAAGMVLCSLAIQGCASGSLYNGHRGKVSIRDDVVVIHVRDTPDAAVAFDGSLRIGGNPISTSEPGRVLLARYFSDANEVVARGKAIGLDALHRRLGALDADDRRICEQLNLWSALQPEIAAQVPEFAPYQAVIEPE